jgi:UDP-GlcNAc:undecaprenyl-phosphate GlcNAc-1-phosphate transferase
MRYEIYQFAFPFFIAVGLSLLFTIIVRLVAVKLNIFDRPLKERKMHKKPVPLFGGIGLFLGVIVTLLIYLIWDEAFFIGYMLPKYIIGIFAGGGVLIFGGVLDDKFDLSPGKQIVWPIIAALIIISSGIGIDFISNPLGRAVQLDSINIKLFELDGVPYHFTPLADIFTFIWLLGMMYTTKFLDGLDGLVSGITVIGSVILFFLSLTPNVMQPETALLCIIMAGVSLGFLFLNFHPAKIFLGEGGSTFTGFMLGTLAIISGGKIATALLIMGIPILDVVWVIVRRVWRKRSPFKSADKKHLHFRLLDIGFSHRGAVLFLYLISGLFGTVSLLVQGEIKVFALFILVIFMIMLGFFLILRAKYRSKEALDKF